MIKSTGVQNLSDDEVYITIKNNAEASTWVMIHVASDSFANRKVTADTQVITRYDADGAEVGTSVVNGAGYFELPAAFNGFLKFSLSDLSLTPLKAFAYFLVKNFTFDSYNGLLFKYSFASKFGSYITFKISHKI